jgi:ribosomal protein S18 acetylase RimI-like enzyme
MLIIIRLATVNDAEQISNVWKVICAERVYTAIDRPFTPQEEKGYIESLSEREGIFLAILNNKIIGFQSLDLWAKFSDSFNHVGVIGTFVLPEWRRRKVGYKLAEYIFNFARKNGYEKLVIYVRSSNLNAQAFYKKLGFVSNGVLVKQVKIDGKYDDEIFMELFL